MARRRLLAVFLLLGLVALLADAAYEGARSVSGPLIQVLGGGALAAGAVAAGEALSYAGRLLGGVLAHRARSGPRLWAVVVAGYTLNLAVVPLLALAWDWRVALALYWLERLGKGLRAPGKDAIIAEATAGMGPGRGFALHEVLDQAGAVAGPLLVAYSASRHGVPQGLLVLAVPAAAALALVLAAALLYPEPEAARKPREPLPPWLPGYLAGLALLAASFIHWGLASYLISGPVEAAGYYSLAMLADALAALALGEAHHRLGPGAVLLLPPIAAASTITLASHPGPLAAILWGTVMGGLEVLPKAAIADRVPAGARSLAYALMGLALGAGWAAGTLAYSLAPEAAVLSVAPAAASMIVLWRSLRKTREGELQGGG